MLRSCIAEGAARLANKGMKQTSAERIGCSQLIPNVGPTCVALQAQ
jgi:hypothetical protein